MAKFKIENPYYPIVYVRGYAMTSNEREQVFNDAYYGFGVSSVEKRDAPAPDYFRADIFEGLLIRLIKDHRYVDSTNQGLLADAASETPYFNPSRSIWVSRFYDGDYFNQSIRSMEEHAEDLRALICKTIPSKLKDHDVDTSNLKVILLAHSMGGLVCRTLIQKTLPDNGMAAKDLIHRFVTMGTPHKGIDLGSIPDLLENAVVTALNPKDSSIFKEDRMRQYLGLAQPKKGLKKKPKEADDFLYDVHSIGPVDRFPIKRCLCLIGSDWTSYGVVRKLTGGVSDGLVKQSRAYLVGGPRPVAGNKSDDDTPDYDDAQRAYWANVHRAHSGYRGIVNSYESYENIQRFLFGTTIFHIALDDIEIHTKREADSTYTHDFEFMLSIRGTNAFLHRRQQDPCENAFRFTADDSDNKKPGLPKRLHLHTGFLNSRLRRKDDPYSYFRLTFHVLERRVRKGLLWDHDYPASVIYSETMEARIDIPSDTTGGGAGPVVEYRWLSDLSAGAGEGWQKAQYVDGAFQANMRAASTFSAKLTVKAGEWPDPGLTLD